MSDSQFLLGSQFCPENSQSVLAPLEFSIQRQGKSSQQNSQDVSLMGRVFVLHCGVFLEVAKTKNLEFIVIFVQHVCTSDGKIQWSLTLVEYRVTVTQPKNN